MLYLKCSVVLQKQSFFNISAHSVTWKGRGLLKTIKIRFNDMNPTFIRIFQKFLSFCSSIVLFHRKMNQQYDLECIVIE